MSESEPIVTEYSGNSAGIFDNLTYVSCTWSNAMLAPGSVRAFMWQPPKLWQLRNVELYGLHPPNLPPGALVFPPPRPHKKLDIESVVLTNTICTAFRRTPWPIMTPQDVVRIVVRNDDSSEAHGFHLILRGIAVGVEGP